MDEDNIPTKRFKVTFEFDAIPYNEETFELIGDLFFPEWSEDIYAKEDVGDLISNAIFGSAYTTMIKDPPSHRRFKSFEEYLKYIKSKNYSTFAELCGHEHPHRLLKQWNIGIEKIHEIYRN